MKIKYRSLARELRRVIDEEEYAPGDALPSQSNLADRFGVNPRTVARALDVLEEDELITRKRGSGTYISDLPDSRTTTPLLYIGRTEGHFHKDLYCALTAEAQRSGPGVIAFSPWQETEELQDSEHLRALLESSQRIICASQHWSKLREIVPNKCHVVLVSGFSGSVDTDQTSAGYTVATNIKHASQLATEHLLELGHRRIALVSVGWEPGESAEVRRIPPDASVYQGYHLALRSNEINQEFPMGCPHSGSDKDFRGVTMKALEKHFASMDELPTAFVCETDFRASVLLNLMRSRGLEAPRDFSVVGIGNTPWAEMTHPRLTSVSLREEVMSRVAVDLCSGEPPSGPAVVRIDPELVERNSTKAPTET
ncbi:MAG: substrate-binding domain-containing protein [Candidatus Brocadiia bacterium]